MLGHLSILKHGAPEVGEVPDAADTGEGGVTIGPSSAASTFPLLPIEVMARNHALLCTIGFLILLPFGTLVARYARTFTRR